MVRTAFKLKIGLVLDDGLDTTDGVQQYVLALGSWLQAQGHEVHYLVGQTMRTDILNLHSLSRNLAVHFNGNRLTVPLPTTNRRLKAFITSQQFDILHVQMPYSPWLAQRIIKAAPSHTKIIGTFHILPSSQLVRWSTKLLAIWTRSSLRRFSSIVSVSPAAAVFARQTYGITTNVVPNMLDYELFHAAADRVQSVAAGQTIVFLGRLVPRKGCLTLLQAIAVLRDRMDLTHTRVMIAGKGPLSDMLRTYTEQHTLTSIVSFVGFVAEADKPAFYASADIAVFPSSGGESFGIVLLEAMASGRAAVLAGDNPGYHSVMEPRPKQLFEPNRPWQLADKLAYFMTNTEARLQAAKWGEIYTKTFDRNVVGRQIEDIYYQALPSASKP